jgi:solute carrier family 25 carnitine/acylcarnitine transporter 20/29
MWSGFTGSLAFRSNFFWMFLSFEVSQPCVFISELNLIYTPKALMRSFSRLAGTPFEVLVRDSETLYTECLTRIKISTGSANFISGGLGAFAFWGMAIPADNVKKQGIHSPTNRHLLNSLNLAAE